MNTKNNLLKSFLKNDKFLQTYKNVNKEKRNCNTNEF